MGKVVRTLSPYHNTQGLVGWCFFFQIVFIYFGIVLLGLWVILATFIFRMDRHAP